MKATPTSADVAKLRALEYCLFHYPTLYTAGVPYRDAHTPANVWVVPVMLEDPEAGISKTVGELHIDVGSEKVICSTPAGEVVAAGTRLYEEKRHARRAAAVPPTKK